MFEDMEEKSQLAFDRFIDKAAEESRLLAADIASVIEAQARSELATLIALFMVNALIKNKFIQRTPERAEEMQQSIDHLERVISENTIKQFQAFEQMRRNQSDE